MVEEQALGSGDDDARSFPAQVGMWARRVPYRPAVTGADGKLTYAELIARAAAFGRDLDQHLDGAVEPLVALRVGRGVDMVAWLLAILSRGAAYLPIDPGLPLARITQMLDDARPALLLTDEALLTDLPPTDLPILRTDAGRTGAAVPFQPRCSPDDLAYLLYTSGSTGRPKGVEIQQSALSAFLAAAASAGLVGEGERLLALTRLGFDISVLELMLPLWVGGTVVVLPADETADPRRLAAAIVAHRPDVVQATPASWRSLLDAGWQGDADLRILCGGEALLPDLAARLLPRCGALWNCYGPTETTVWSTIQRVEAGDGPVPVGYPLPGTEILILDQRGEPVEPGATGEIVIAAPSTARGYRGMPELTATRFLTLPDGRRSYRTGDLGHRPAGGPLFCLGRLDDQVKVRGFRIELGDVEHALGAHPQVRWGAVRVWPDPTGETALVAYVVLHDGQPIPARQVTKFLGDRLPPYMVPQRIVTLAKMPLTPNGKVDRHALPDPFLLQPRMASAGEAWGTEARLSAIWMDLLGVSAIDPDDDFFDLGGYSLITVRLLCRIEEVFGRTLEIGDLIRASTLQDMAALIEAPVVRCVGPLLLNRDGTRPPLHWIDAGPLVRNMARAMPVDQPVYGINLTRAEERQFPAGPLDLSRIAALLRRRVLDVQATGPFLIGGWCRWAVVAHELACQLEARGHRVALLVNLDGPAPVGGLTRFASAARLWLSGTPRAPAAESFGERVQDAARRHSLARYRGDMLLLRPDDDGPARWEREWQPRIGGRLMVERVPGTHETMIRPPHVDRLAALLARRLSDRELTGAVPSGSPTRDAPATAPSHAVIA